MRKEKQYSQKNSKAKKLKDSTQKNEELETATHLSVNVPDLV